MYIVWGTALYGRVDRVPGWFDVGTQFGHIYYVPLIPTKTWVILQGTEDGNGWKGVEIPMSAKSVLAAWLRAAIAIGMLVSCCFLAVALLEKVPRPESPSAAIWGGTLCGLAVLYWLTVRFSRASYDRALELAEHLGIDREKFAEALALQAGRTPEGATDASSPDSDRL